MYYLLKEKELQVERLFPKSFVKIDVPYVTQALSYS